MTLEDLAKLLTNDLKVGQGEAAAAVEAAAKMIAFKYEAELYKVFTEEDIKKANELEEKSSMDYLHERYEAITGGKSDVLLASITDMIVGDIMKQPKEFFHFSEAK